MLYYFRLFSFRLLCLRKARIDNDVTQVSGLLGESAATGDQAQLCAWCVVVDAAGREVRFRVDLDAVDGEDGGVAVLAVDFDGVALVEGTQVVEDRRAFH